MSKYILLLLLFISTSCAKPESHVELLKLDVLNHIKNEQGTFAVWFQHLEDPELHLGINEDTLFHAASTMKTAVMIELFRRAERGEIDLSDSIKIENSFYSIVDGSEYKLDLDPESDDPFEQRVGEMATLYDLNYAMITYSSNIATNLILQLVGAKETTETVRKLGAESMLILRGLYDMKAFNEGLSNRTTAKDLGILFERVATKKAVSAEMDSLMIEVLKDEYYKDVIPANLPDNVVTATKTGFITGVRHDSAIVYLPDGQSYVLIYLSKDLENEDRGQQIGSEISRMIYDFVVESR